MSEQEKRKQIQMDIDSLYLGNLKTIEFDLFLPNEGKNGSKISWSSSDERWLNNQGKVSQPPFGRGNREIKLTATFTLHNEQLTHVYDVRILEAPNDIKIKKIYSIQLIKKENEAFYLPTGIAVESLDGKVVTQKVNWACNEPLVLAKKGHYTFSGTIYSTDYPVEAQVEIVQKLTRYSVREKKKSLFSLKDVTLDKHSSFYKNQQNYLQFLLSVDDDQMLYNFRKTAGMDTKNAEEMIGWDSLHSRLRGHTTGHYLSALSLASASTKNVRINEKLTYMVSELQKVQEVFSKKSGYQKGYLGGYPETQFDLLEKLHPYPEVWAPYYTLHKILAGLLDAYHYTKNKQALEISKKIGNWVYHRLRKRSYKERQAMWGMYIAGEYGGINESLADLYEITGDSIYLEAARFFDNDYLFYPLEQEVDVLGGLHANQHIPQIVGAMKLYEASGEERYYQIARFFWESVTSNHIYSMGGTGDGEIFQQPNAIASHISKNTAESCASYNLLKLTNALYQYEGTTDLVDYYELALLNHIAASPARDCSGESTYFMATQPGAQRYFEVENSCCHGTGMENHFKYGEFIASYTEESIHINLFLSAKIMAKELGVDLTIDANLDQGTMVIKNRSTSTRQLKIRLPKWTSSMTFSSDGKPQKFALEEGYYVIDQPFEELSITFTLLYAIVEAPDDPGLCSLYYGPYLLGGLSEQTNFLSLDFSEEDLQTQFQKNQTIRQKKTGVEFIPVHQLDNESYHLYFKKDV